MDSDPNTVHELLERIKKNVITSVLLIWPVGTMPPAQFMICPVPLICILSAMYAGLVWSIIRLNVIVLLFVVGTLVKFNVKLAETPE